MCDEVLAHLEGAKNFLGEILGAPNYHEVVQAQGTFVSSMLDSLKSVNMVQADKIVKATKSFGWDASTEKALLAKLGDLTRMVSAVRYERCAGFQGLAKLLHNQAVATLE